MQVRHNHASCKAQRSDIWMRLNRAIIHVTCYTNPPPQMCAYLIDVPAAIIHKIVNTHVMSDL